MSSMRNITVGRYKDPKSVGWAGWIEPEDKDWILFVGLDGRACAFLHRDEHGAILPDDPVERAACLKERAEQREREGKPGQFIGSPCDGTGYSVPSENPHAIGEPVHPLGIYGGGPRT